MNIFKILTSAFALVIALSISAAAQKNEGKGNKIPKDNPPIVIANPDKKDEEKSKNDKGKEDKESKKPESYLSKLIL